MEVAITFDEALDRASDTLKQKMIHSRDLILKAKKLAMMYDPDNGYFLAFSGGKDSQALYHITQLCEVPFKAHFSPTTVDPPQLIRFIRNNYPDVEFGKVKKNIYDTAVEKQILPTMRVRWCCAEYKETAGAGKVTLIGIRHAESARRAKRKEVEVSNRKFSGNFDEFEDWRVEVIKKKYKNLNFDEFAPHKEQMVSCIKGKDSILVSPIIEWTEKDVWEFLNKVVCVPHCELYDKGYHRIGCILCPMSSHKQKMREIRDFPYVKEKWLDAIKAIRRGVTIRESISYGGGTESIILQTPSMGISGPIPNTGQGRIIGNPSPRFLIPKQWLQTPSQFLPTRHMGGGNSERSQEVYEKTKVSGKTVDCPTMGTIPNEELENQIAENIFDWWISGRSYQEWYADKFLQQKIDFSEDEDDS